MRKIVGVNGMTGPLFFIHWLIVFYSPNTLFFFCIFVFHAKSIINGLNIDEIINDIIISTKKNLNLREETK